MGNERDFNSVPPASLGEQSPIGGANSHQSSQWIMHEVNRLSVQVAALAENHKSASETASKTHEKIGSFESKFDHKAEKIDVQLGAVTLNINTIQSDQRHAADNFCKLDAKVAEIDSKLQSISTRITIAATAIVTAAAVLGFVLGSKLTDVLDAMEKLSK
ncbi:MULTISPECIES: hypothetical protein [Aeromonas]|uniref:hypothetical protein n=1 Tax=Aeromonas TaxID=642 RepID=UPI00114CDB10|nr:MULTISPECIES: hypothetical protein [Aeromonas]USP10149.1 hypothetical protein L1S45_00510 [Aeromonas dhakensis]